MDGRHGLGAFGFAGDVLTVTSPWVVHEYAAPALMLAWEASGLPHRGSLSPWGAISGALSP